MRDRPRARYELGLVLALTLPEACTPTAPPAMDAALPDAPPPTDVLAPTDTPAPMDAPPSMDAPDAPPPPMDALAAESSTDALITESSTDAPATEASSEAEAPCATPGLLRCNGACVDIAAHPSNCGRCGVACPTSVHASASCNAGECEQVCDPNFGDCDADLRNGCETDLTTVEHCGRCTQQCTGTDAVCSAGFCTSLEGAPPPRLYAPLSGARVTRKRPELVWYPVSGAGGTQVQLCRRRACAAADVIATLDSPVSRLVVPMDLPAGVYFWRARSGGPGHYGMRYTPTWQFRVPVRDSAVSGSWGSEPDFNGDGLADLVVGAAGFASGAGEVLVYQGSPTGPSAEATWHYVGTDGPRTQLGVDATSAGDVNGDGYVDLLVTAPGAAMVSGRGYIFFGGPDGLAERPAWTLQGPRGPEYMGVIATPAGDVNGDGYADVAMGAPVLDVGAEGSVHFYGGRPDGMATIPAQVLRPPTGTVLHLGRGLSYAGDVNGDGFADLLVGATGQTDAPSGVLVFAGSSIGVAPVPAATLSGDDQWRFGESVSTAGDVNGDGNADVILGSPLGMEGRGVARVHLGSPSGILPRADFEVAGDEDAQCGYWVGGGGDINGDGYDDVAVVCNNARTARVYYGGPAGLTSTSTLLMNASGSTRGFFQARIGLAGDVNGDGFADVVASAPGELSGAGYVCFFLGSAAGVSATPSWTVRGEHPSDNLGIGLGRQ